MNGIDSPCSRWHLKLLVASFLIMGNAASAQAEQDDPTLPSPMIADRLTPVISAVDGDRNVSQPLPVEPLALDLRLKGMVFRDRDNGTAIIGSGDSKTYFVSLRRAEVDAGRRLIRVDGIHLVVIDFSESCIIMQSPETGQRFVVN